MDVSIVNIGLKGVNPNLRPITDRLITQERTMLTKQQSWTNVRERVTPEEWEQRIALAAAYRLVAHFRWDDLIFTHLSARVPGPEHHFLLNPYGMTFDEVTASNLVKVNLAGKK